MLFILCAAHVILPLITICDVKTSNIHTVKGIKSARLGRSSVIKS